MDVTLRFYDATKMVVVREHSYYEMLGFSIQELVDIVKAVFNVYKLSVDYLVSIDKDSNVPDEDIIFNIVISCPHVSDSILDDILLTVNSVVICRYSRD